MFITFEGIEGVGKTTQIKFLENYLKNRHINLLVTREPGGTEMGEEIRDVLLKHRNDKVSPLTEVLLMFGARAEHLASVILPNLKRGIWVLSDRFTDASYAYQGGGRQLPLEYIQDLENLVQGDFRPDLVFILDAPPEVGLARAKNRSHPDRFEQEKIDFFVRVRETYLRRAKNEPDRYKVLDATQSISSIQEKIVKIMEPFLINEHHTHI